MVNKSTWRIPQDPTKGYDVQADFFRENKYVSTDNLGESFKNDGEHEERDEVSSNPTVHSFDLESASNSAIQPGYKEHSHKSRRSIKSLPHAHTKSSLHCLAISGPSTVQTPADSQDTEESNHKYS